MCPGRKERIYETSERPKDKINYWNKGSDSRGVIVLSRGQNIQRGNE